MPKRKSRKTAKHSHGVGSHDLNIVVSNRFTPELLHWFSEIGFTVKPEPGLSENGAVLDSFSPVHEHGKTTDTSACTMSDRPKNSDGNKGLGGCGAK
ncbi:hypothetical protein H1R20_g12844, partial [Candolleomyces eurysporus]